MWIPFSFEEALFGVEKIFSITAKEPVILCGGMAQNQEHNNLKPVINSWAGVVCALFILLWFLFIFSWIFLLVFMLCVEGGVVLFFFRG